MQRMAVIARLKPGMSERAEALLEKGPPFDPERLGFEQHTVYFSGDEAIFVFEGVPPGSLLTTLAGNGQQKLVAAWEPLLDGPPRVAREAYAWTRRDRTLFDRSWGE